MMGRVAMRGKQAGAFAITVVLATLSAQVSLAQSGVFRSARTFPFGGSSDDATPLLAAVDVGSPSTSATAGAPDGIPDLVTLTLFPPQKALVLIGDGHGGFTTSSRLATTLNVVPTALGAADFDGDGLTDLLVADDSDHVFFFAGNSAGPPFTAPGISSPTGQMVCQAGPKMGMVCTTNADCGGSLCAAAHGPVAIAAGKIDGDAHLDAVIVENGGQESGSGSITVLLGKGNGTFTPGVPISTGIGSGAVALWDSTGDGQIDYAAVANAGGNNISVLHNDGSGNFTLMNTYDVDQEPVAIAAADLNADGHVELIVVNRTSDDIAVLDGQADGTFKPARLFASGSMASAPNGLVVTDMNGDHKTDVVVSNNFSFDASVLLGDGKGGFAAPRAFIADQEPLAIVSADFDHDGKQDVATVNHDGTFLTAAVLLGRGDGSLQGVENVIAPQFPIAVTVGDIDNDGRADLIAGDTNKELLVFRAVPKLAFAAPVTLKANGDVVAVGHGDFNGDGLLDLVSANASTKDLSVFLGQADGSFASMQNPALGTAPTAVAVGDWNSDGLSDLAVTFQVRQCNVTTATACSSTSSCPMGQCSVTATRKCHTKSDCPSGETCNGGETCVGAVGILLAQPSGGFGPLTTLPVGTGTVAIDLGDFNKDGKLDLVAANTQSNDLSILIGNGDGTFQTAKSVPSSGGPLTLAVADFDRDGFDDVAVAQSVSSNVVVLYGNGQGGFNPGIPQGAGTNLSSLVARDVTGDSIPDLLVTNQGDSNALVVLVGGGANKQFTSQSPVGLSRAPFNVVAADFDGDGRYDAAAAYQNQYASALPVLTNVSAPAVLRGDGNGDGKVSAADAVAVMRKVVEHDGTRIEDVRMSGYAAAPGVDANGDGVVTPQDALAVAHRLFSRM